jgi:hypothetical protein
MDQGVAITMVILGSLMPVPLFFANIVNDAAALLFAFGGDFLSVFDKSQRDALTRLFLSLHRQLDLANMIFWGLWLLPLGLPAPLSWRVATRRPCAACQPALSQRSSPSA